MPDKILIWRTVHKEVDKLGIVRKVQVVDRESGARTVQIYMPLSDMNIEKRAVSLTPTYEELRAIFQELVKLYGKEEVLREMTEA